MDDNPEVAQDVERKIKERYVGVVAGGGAKTLLTIN